MKTVLSIFIGVCWLNCFCGCGQSDTEPQGDAIVIPYVNEAAESIMADSVFFEIEFVPLETNEKCLLSGVQQVEFRDSLIFLCDDHRLFVFNDSGKFISQIGREGRGPGEYVGFRGFFVDMENRTVNIITPSQESIMVYAFDRTYLFSEKIPPGLYDWGYFAIPVEDEKILIFNSHNPGNNMAYTLYDRKKPEEPLYFNSYDPVRIEDYTYHFSTRPMSRFGGNVHFTMPLDHYIYEYSRGNVSAKYYLETPLEIIPKDEMLKEDDTYLTRLVKLTMNNYFGGFTEIFETDDLIFLHYMAKLSYPGLYILDKENNVGKYFVYPSPDEKLRYPVFPFSASDGNRLVSVVPTDDVMKLKDYIADNEIEDEKICADFKETIDKMDEYSNPLLVFYKVTSLTRETIK
jgi:hypothetical protein